MKTIAQQINWDYKINGDLEIRNKNDNLIYYELSDGWWAKTQYDLNGNEIYHDNSTGFWVKREYDSQGNIIYFENSDGQIVDSRPKPSEDRVIEIDGVKYKLIKL